MSPENSLQELNRVSVISKLHGAHRLQPSRPLAFRQVFFRFHGHIIRCAICRWLQSAFPTCLLANDLQAASQSPVGLLPGPPASPSEPENLSRRAKRPEPEMPDLAGEAASALPWKAPTRQKRAVHSTLPLRPRRTWRAHAQRAPRNRKSTWRGELT